MPGLYPVLGSRAVLVCGLLGGWNLKLQVETTQQEQQTPCAGPWREDWERGPEFFLQVNGPDVCACCPGLCNLQLGYSWVRLSQIPARRGAGGDSPLWIIIPDTFLIAVLSVSLLRGLQIQSDWKKQSFWAV